MMYYCHETSLKMTENAKTVRICMLRELTFESFNYLH